MFLNNIRVTYVGFHDLPFYRNIDNSIIDFDFESCLENLLKYENKIRKK